MASPQTTAGDLRRGDTLTGVDGHPTTAETVTRVETDGDLVAITTRRGPQRRQTVRHLPAATPVTTDPPLPRWRFTDRQRERSGDGFGNAASFATGLALGLISNRRPVQDTDPVLRRRETFAPSSDDSG